MARVKFICDNERCTEYDACATARKNEHEIPWGMNRRRAVMISDGMIGAEKSILVACVHCSDASCMAACPVGCPYHIEDGVVLCDRDVCIDCGYCSYAYPFGTPQFLNQGTLGVHDKMNGCTFCVGDPEKNDSEEEFEKYGRDHLVEGKSPLCAEVCSTKVLLDGDGDVISDILCNRVTKCGKGAESFGRGTAYGDTQGEDGQMAPATPAVPTKPALAPEAQS